MSFILRFQNILDSAPISRRQALMGLSLFALTACSHSASTVDAGVAYYTCTMHPFVRSQDPKGRCPVCGMNFVAVAKSSANAGAPQTTFIAPDRLKEIGARAETVAVKPGTNLLIIPAEAVLPTGNKFIVFIDHGDGQVEPREIKVGNQVGTSYEVTSGLKQEDRVFVAAIFLIDSECRIQGVLKTWGDRK